MTDTKEIIIKLKKVREEKNLSYNDIVKMIEETGQFVSKTTISRVFSDGSEEMSFKYEETIRPIANALLDIENIEPDDNMSVQAMKTILVYKSERINELLQEIEKLTSNLDKEKIKYHEKLDKERARHERATDFLKNQIELKDKRMDQLLEAVFTKDSQHKQLIDRILGCQCRNCAPSEMQA